jgi:hypothetical protein
VGAPAVKAGERRQRSPAVRFPSASEALDPQEDHVDPTTEDVLAVLGDLPLGIGPLGLEVVRRAGGELGDDEAAPVGQRLAVAGLSLSALQRLVDELVHDGLVEEVRGGDLWDRGLPTAGTKARGRYYLAVST